MTLVEQLLAELAGNDIQLSVVGQGQLKLAGNKAKLRGELLERVKANKAALLTELAVPREVPASFAQERFWLLARLNGNDAIYNLSFVRRFGHALDTALLHAAFNALIERHRVLRTVYYEKDRRVYQQLLNDWKFNLECHDLSELAVDTAQQRCKEGIALSAKQPFDLSNGLSVRAEFYRLPDQRCAVHWCVHHIACDTTSVELLSEQLIELYGLLAEGQSLAAPLHTHYSDFAKWQRQTFDNGNMQTSVEYWRRQLQGLPAVHQLPLDFPRPAYQTYAGREVEAVLDVQATNGLKRLAGRHGMTLFMLVHAAYAWTLSRFSGENDIVIGTPFLARPDSSYDSVVGLFQDTRVLRLDCHGSQTLAAFFSQARSVHLEAIAHQQMPFALLVDLLNPPRSNQYSPLFQLLMVMYVNDHSLAEAGPLGEVRQEGIVSRFDMALCADAYTDGVRLNLEFNCDLFSSYTAQRVLDYLTRVLTRLSSAEVIQLAELALTCPQEVAEMSSHLRGPTMAYDKSTTLQVLFEQQVSRTPQKIALSSPDGTSMSYAELNQRANAIAVQLVTRGFNAGDIVAVCLPRNTELVVTLLAVLKAGCAYLPLDPSHPPQRHSQLLQDSGAVLVVTCSDLLENFVGVECLAINHLPHANDSVMAEVLGCSGQSTAYVLYTSGSTGKPKGVMVSHQAAVNLLHGAILRFGLAQRCDSLFLTTISFDIALLEWFAPLINGGCCYIVNETQQQDVSLLLRYIARVPVNFIQATPSRWRQMLLAGWQGKSGAEIAIGGEPIELSLYLELSGLGNRIWHCYGPTEATVWSAIDVVDEADRARGLISIKGTLPNYQHLVLDEQLQPVPRGVVGRLFIAGDGLAQGYLRQPALTEERFIEKLPAHLGLSRIYDTGDKARWCGGGSLIFAGRDDNQTKLNGFRIELGEVQKAILGLTKVAMAVVTVKTLYPGNRQLVAFYSLKPDCRCDSDELTAALRDILPDYMCPTLWVEMAQWPLTLNEKIDLKQLFEQPFAFAEVVEKAATTALQRQLQAVWKNVLNRSCIAVDKTLFELGGNSLTLVSLAAQLKAAGLPLEIKTVLEHNTIEQQARWLSTVGNSQSVSQAEACVVKLNHGQGQPLFFIHPLLGGAFCYQELARYLEPICPVYGIQAPFIAGLPFRFDDKIDLAKLYLEGIRSIQPQGPYRIGGASSGGKLAYLVAELLVSQGEEVAMLLSLDSAPPGLMDQAITDEKAVLIETIEFLLGADQVPGELIADASDIAALEMQLVMLLEDSGRFGSIDCRLGLNFFIDFFAADPSERPLSISGEVLHFSPNESPYKKQMNECWQQKLTGTFKVYDMPGSHMDFMEGDNFLGFAQKIKSTLASCEKQIG